MGFWGSFVVCRSATPLAELSAVARRCADLVWHQEHPGGWQVGQYPGPELDEDSQPMLQELVAATGSPALTGSVSDSDAVAVEGYSAAHGHWHACLARAAMAAYCEMDGEDFDVAFPTAEAATASAVIWATDAGLSPDAGEVRRILGADQAEPFAEDLFFDLLTALGVLPKTAVGRADRGVEPPTPEDTGS